MSTRDEKQFQESLDIKDMMESAGWKLFEIRVQESIEFEEGELERMNKDILLDKNLSKVGEFGARLLAINSRLSGLREMKNIIDGYLHKGGKSAERID